MVSAITIPSAILMERGAASTPANQVQTVMIVHPTLQRRRHRSRRRCNLGRYVQMSAYLQMMVSAITIPSAILMERGTAGTPANQVQTVMIVHPTLQRRRHRSRRRCNLGRYVQTSAYLQMMVNAITIPSAILMERGTAFTLANQVQTVMIAPPTPQYHYRHRCRRRHGHHHQSIVAIGVLQTEYVKMAPKAQAPLFAYSALIVPIAACDTVPRPRHQPRSFSPAMPQESSSRTAMGKLACTRIKEIGRNGRCIERVRAGDTCSYRNTFGCPIREEVFAVPTEKRWAVWDDPTFRSGCSPLGCGSKEHDKVPCSVKKASHSTCSRVVIRSYTQAVLHHIHGL